MTLEVIDSHVHFWDVGHNWYPDLKQMAEAVDDPRLFTSFSRSDYDTESGGLQLAGLVHISAVTAPHTHLEELTWLLDSMADRSTPMRYVGTVDPTDTAHEMCRDLDAQLATTTDLTGIRVFRGLEPGSPAASTLLSWLAANDRVFELVSGPEALSAWAEEIRRYSGLRVVLEHTGWPSGTDDRSRETWRTAMRRFADESSAVCKISGLGMIGGLTVEALQPWVDATTDMFGWDRVMFGSNMPVERMGGDCRQLLASLDEILDDASSEQRQRFYSQNAAHMYGFEGKNEHIV